MKRNISHIFRFTAKKNISAMLYFSHHTLRFFDTPLDVLLPWLQKYRGWK